MGFLSLAQEIMESLFLETNGGDDGDCPEVTELLVEGDFYEQQDTEEYLEEIEDEYSTSVGAR